MATEHNRSELDPMMVHAGAADGDVMESVVVPAPDAADEVVGHGFVLTPLPPMPAPPMPTLNFPDPPFRP